jgi:hypothetical protein
MPAIECLAGECGILEPRAQEKELVTIHAVHPSVAAERWLLLPLHAALASAETGRSSNAGFECRRQFTAPRGRVCLARIQIRLESQSLERSSSG